MKEISNDAVDRIRDAYCAFENSDKSAFSYSVFVGCVLDCTQIAIAKNIPFDERIERALTYIQSRLHDKITCEDVAGHIFLIGRKMFASVQRTDWNDVCSIFDIPKSHKDLYGHDKRKIYHRCIP